MTAPIGLFYGSSTCYTEIVAERIQQRLGKDKVDINNIVRVPITDVYLYDFLIFGIPTWDYGELQEDWDAVWDDLADLDLSGKTAAVYGLGDQLGYPQWFQDALGYLYYQLQACGATMTGHWPNEGYHFQASQGLTEDGTHFLGLALDEETQYDLTEDRINQWLESLPLP